MARSRTRFDGGPEAISSILEPLMHSFTWLQYGENEKAKLNVPIIKKHKGMLQSFSCLKRTLTFKKTDMKAAVTAARLKVQKSWLHHLKHDEIAEWDKVMTNRIMTLCRHTSQGILNARAWAKDLHLSEALDEATGSAGESATQLSAGESAKQLPSAEVEQAASAQSVWFGYDHELKQAWRKVGEQRKEFSDDWLMQGADTDAVQVRFQDGSIREVAELSIGDLKQMQQVRSAPTSLWEGTHVASGDKVTIRPKADRQMLTVIMHGDRMVCMVKTAYWEGHDEAGKFLQPIAKRYCAEDLTKKQLYALRDQALADATNLRVPDGESSSSACKKRPAASFVGLQKATCSERIKTLKNVAWTDDENDDEAEADEAEAEAPPCKKRLAASKAVHEPKKKEDTHMEAEAEAPPCLKRPAASKAVHEPKAEEETHFDTSGIGFFANAGQGFESSPSVYSPTLPESPRAF